jgi:ribosomal protein S18 acetylase RimI-like enzyme
VRSGDAVVAVATVTPEPHPDDPRDGDWRVRGMATAPEARSRGHGAALVAACLDHARREGGRRAWCNARVGAIALYERAGFVREGDVFEEPGIGPHVRMARPLR